MYTICEICLLCLICHLLGDYVLQIDYLAKTKGDNLYHLFVHSVLYCVPFYLLLNINIIAYFILFATHFIIDALKASLKVINYPIDQVLHYMVLIILLLLNIIP